jgi:hypothetical protein
MIGRACLGRPWVFTDAATALSGDPAAWPPPLPPRLGGVLRTALRHVTALADWEGSERGAVLAMRKLVGSYLAGFDRPDIARPLYEAASLADWAAVVRAHGDDPTPFPAAALRLARLKGGATDHRPQRQRVSLPAGWLEGRDNPDVPDFLSGDACEG